MQPIGEPEPHHRLLHHKLKGSSAPTYLTALSVIQGVALADLGSIAVAHSQQFTVEQWLLGVLSFGMLITIWDAYTTQSALWNWIPDLRDAVSPFVFGALELFLNQAIILSLSAWLLALALLTGTAAFANWYTGWRAKEESENSRLLSLRSGWRRRFGILSTLGFSVLSLLLAVISRVGGVEATAGIPTGRGVLALVIALLAGAGLGTYIFFNQRNWRQIVAYARSGRLPNRDETQANEERSP
jgi:hypothetical protein